MLVRVLLADEDGSRGGIVMGEMDDILLEGEVQSGLKEASVSIGRLTVLDLCSSGPGIQEVLVSQWNPGEPPSLLVGTLYMIYKIYIICIYKQHEIFCWYANGTQVNSLITGSHSLCDTRDLYHLYI